MKRRLNKKAFTLVEIVIAIAILAAASIGIGAVIIGAQNNTEKQLTQGELQQQLTEVQESLRNDLLTTNAGVKYWVKDDADTYITDKGALSYPDRDKLFAMYSMDYLDNTLTRKYVKYDAEEDMLYKAEVVETVTFDNSKKLLLDESAESIATDTELQWHVYAQSITNFSMDLSKYEDNNTVNYNVNINNESSDYESDNTVNVRNVITVNEATVLESYDQAVVARPTLKNTTFVYNGEVQKPKQLDVNSRYIEIKIEDPTRDKTEAVDAGTYRIIYHLKNAVWNDGTKDDYIIEWKITPRVLVVNWGTTRWIYDGTAKSTTVTLGNRVPGDTIGENIENNQVGPEFGTQIATLVITNPNYAIPEEDKQVELAIVKGAATFTEVPKARTLTYNGQAQELVTPGVTNCGQVLYCLTATGTFTPNIPTATSANNETPYLVYYYIKGNENFDDSKKQYLEVVINRADTDITPPIPFDGVDHVARYTGKAQNLLYQGGSLSFKGQAIPASETTMVYSLDGRNYSETIPQGLKAQRYTVWYKAKQSTNFKESRPAYVEAEITKAERPLDSFILPVARDLTYNGTQQYLFEEQPNSITQGGYWMYQVEGETSWFASIPTREAAGTYNVRVKIPETEDYAEYVHPDVLSVTIKKAPAAYVVAPEAIRGLFYDGTMQALATPGTTRDGNIMFAFAAGQNQPAPDQTIMTRDTPKALNAGWYTVFHYIKGDSNHFDSEVMQFNVEIAKAIAQITSKPHGVDVEYNGTEQPLVDVNSVGLADSGAQIEFTLNEYGEGGWSTTIPTKMNVGEYTVYYRSKATDNYTESKIESFISRIIQAQNQIVAPSGNMQLVYNGSLQKLLASNGSASFGEIEYCLPNGEWTKSPNAIASTDAGEYVIKWKVEETDNYTGSSGETTARISAQKIEGIEPPKGLTLTYNGQAQELLVEGKVPQGYHFEYRFNSDNYMWGKNIPTGKDVGVYYIEYRVVPDGEEGTNNIYVEDSVIKAEIQKATPIITITPRDDLVYTGLPQVLIYEDSVVIAPNLPDIQIEYALEENANEGNYVKNVTEITGTNAGTYKVVWRIRENHNIVAMSGSVDVTIARKLIEVPILEKTQLSYTGQEQTPVPIIREQDIEWIENKIKPGIDVAQYKATFTLRGWNDTEANTQWAFNGVPATGVQDTQDYNIDWEITKSDEMAALTVAPTGRTLVYNGKVQALIYEKGKHEENIEDPNHVTCDCSKAPSNVEGTILYYRIVQYAPYVEDVEKAEWKDIPGVDDMSWSTNTPSACNAGYYKVEFKLDGGANYNDIKPTEFITTIAKADIAVINNYLENIYDGKYFRPEFNIVGLDDSIEREFTLGTDNNTFNLKYKAPSIYEKTKDDNTTEMVHDMEDPSAEENQGYYLGYINASDNPYIVYYQLTVTDTSTSDILTGEATEEENALVSAMKDNYNVTQDKVEYIINPTRATYSRSPQTVITKYNGQSHVLVTWETEGENAIELVGMKFQYRFKKIITDENDTSPDSWTEWRDLDISKKPEEITDILESTNAGMWDVEFKCVALNTNYNFSETVEVPVLNEDGQQKLDDNQQPVFTTTTHYYSEKVLTAQQAVVDKINITMLREPTGVGTILYDPYKMQNLLDTKMLAEIKDVTEEGKEDPIAANNSYVTYTVIFTPDNETQSYMYTYGAGTKDEAGNTTIYLNADVKNMKARDKGTYEIYWSVKGDENHEDYTKEGGSASRPANCIIVQIIDGPQSSTTGYPEVIPNAAYTGRATQLFTVGSAADTQYEYSQDGKNWTTDTSVLYGINEGEYKLYWRYKATDATAWTNGQTLTVTLGISTLDVAKLRNMLINDYNNTPVDAKPTQVIFTPYVDVTGLTDAIDVSSSGNGSILAWGETIDLGGVDGIDVNTKIRTIYITTSNPGRLIPASCSLEGLFESVFTTDVFANLNYIDVSGLDVSELANTARMFKGFGYNIGQTVQIDGFKSWSNKHQLNHVDEMFVNMGYNANTVTCEANVLGLQDMGINLSALFEGYGQNAHTRKNGVMKYENEGE